MVSVCPGSFQALPEQIDRHHCGAWKILTVITQLTGGGQQGGAKHGWRGPAEGGPARARRGRAGKDWAEGGQHGRRGGTNGEGPGERGQHGPRG
jgi:hypothetical protein